MNLERENRGNKNKDWRGGREGGRAIGFGE